MAEKNKPVESSFASMAEATRGRLEFSGHGAALGAGGVKQESDHPENCEFLTKPGDSVAISMGAEGFKSMMIGVAWDNIHAGEKKGGILTKILGGGKRAGVDLDIGCFYELTNGKRGALQAFGDKFGDFDKAPFIKLSGDERSGDAEGQDEYMLVNGAHWSEIKRIMVYIYIYEGALRWSDIHPQIVVDVPGENDLYVTLKEHDDRLDLCAVAQLENVRGGIKLTNCTEFFPGHEEMDRAFGFGLEWEDGKKS